MMKTLKKKNRFIIIRLTFILLLVVGNTFAWFIYTTKVDNKIDVHVRAWNVLFQAGEQAVEDYVNLDVESIYPGMEDYEYSLQARNQGDVDATLSYELLEARIFDDTYVSIEGRNARKEEVQPGDMTSKELLRTITNNYPFKISISISDTTMHSHDGYAVYNFTVKWPFESDNDEEDTKWGIIASNFKKSHTDTSSITLKIKVIITQNNS
ncbi:MAG: hypothetical protein K6C11_01775 [Bacilli bacterium]|nr:hypothetical protein [Bacilli bacterium]